MSDAFLETIRATIAYLEQMKAEGSSWVAVPPELLAQLAVPTPGRAEQSKTLMREPAPPITPVVKAVPLVVRPEPPQPVLAPASLDKAAQMAELRARALSCQRCPPLVASRKTVVFGVGDIHASLMFVGEAPGADEDVQGEPFVGAAGQLLTRMITAMGFSRETVYIANVLKCRPHTPDQTSGNRRPTPEEMQTCLPFLSEQIRIIQPKVIVALGATAVEGLFGRPMPITRLRGQWQELHGTPVMPTFHPSYLLRNQARAVKRQVWEDMLQVLEKLAVPISEKQRNFFR